MGHRVKCSLSAAYHQFYLIDEGCSPVAPTTFSEEDRRLRLAVRSHLILVMTFQPNLVNVAVEFTDSEPLLDEAEWDHIAECSLDLPTGQLAVDTVGRLAARMHVTPGAYRVRLCLAGIRDWRTVPDGEDPPEAYQITLWPTSPVPATVRKAWDGPFSI